MFEYGTSGVAWAQAAACYGVVWCWAVRYSSRVLGPCPCCCCWFGYSRIHTRRENVSTLSYQNITRQGRANNNTTAGII